MLYFWINKVIRKRNPHIEKKHPYITVSDEAWVNKTLVLKGRNIVKHSHKSNFGSNADTAKKKHLEFHNVILNLKNNQKIFHRFLIISRVCAIFTYLKIAFFACFFSLFFAKLQNITKTFFCIWAVPQSNFMAQK